MEPNERLKKVRKELGLKQQQAAEFLEMSRSNYANIETGAVAMTDRTIKTICREFSVNKEWLLTGEGPQRPPGRMGSEEIAAFAGNVINDPDESFRRRLILALAKLGDEDWKSLEGILDKLNERDS